MRHTAGALLARYSAIYRFSLTDRPRYVHYVPRYVTLRHVILSIIIDTFTLIRAMPLILPLRFLIALYYDDVACHCRDVTLPLAMMMPLLLPAITLRAMLARCYIHAGVMMPICCRCYVVDALLTRTRATPLFLLFDDAMPP